MSIVRVGPAVNTLLQTPSMHVQEVTQREYNRPNSMVECESREASNQFRLGSSEISWLV